MRVLFKLLNSYLLVAVTLSYISGISCTAPLSSFTAALSVVTIISVPLLLLFFLKKENNLARCTLLVLFFVFGWYQGNISSNPPTVPHHIYHQIENKTDTVLIGHLSSMVTYDGRSSRAEIELLAYRTETAPHFHKSCGKVLLKLYGIWPERYQPGVVLAIRAVVNKPFAYGTPGTFDYPAYLARKNIWVTGYLRSPAQITEIQIDQSIFKKSSFFPERLRTSVAEFIDLSCPKSQAAIFRAILLGDRSRIPHETLENFKNIGTMHILAISGIHLSLIAGLLFLALYWLLRRSSFLIVNFNVKKTALLLTVPAITLYAMLAGLNAPVLRASIMASIVVLGFCSDRPRSLSTLISCAAFLILLFSPQALFTASFQLSFVAFSSISLFSTKIHSLLKKPEQHQINFGFLLYRSLRYCLAGLMVSGVATLGTAPLIIYHFNRLPLIGPFANLLLEPLICLWALPAGFVAMGLIPILPAVAKALFGMGGYGLEVALKLASELSANLGISLWLPTPALPLIVGYYLILLLFGSHLNIGNKRKLLFSTPLMITAIVLLIVPVSPKRISPFYKSGDQVSKIHFLDIGQGSATVLQLSDGQTILIDGGGSSYPGSSPGQKIIAPFLFRLGITNLDYIFITHFDSDHCNGIPFILQNFSVGTLVIPDCNSENSMYFKIVKGAERRGTRVLEARSGEQFAFSDSTITCLANTSKIRNLVDDSNNGLVLQIETDGYTVLFPGDIHGSTEQAIVKALENCDVLLASHHGSVTSNSAEFLEAVQPRVIIVSAGQGSKERFPSKQLRSYCDTMQIPLLTTADFGTLELSAQRGALEIYTLRNKRVNPLQQIKRKQLDLNKDLHLSLVP